MDSAKFDLASKAKTQSNEENYKKVVKFKREISEIAIKRKRRIFNSKSSLSFINRRFGHETIQSNILINNHHNDDKDFHKRYDKNDTIGYVHQNKTKIGEIFKKKQSDSNHSIELHSYVTENDVRLEESNSLSNAVQMTPKRLILGLVSQKNSCKDCINDSTMKIDADDMYINVPYINQEIVEENSEDDSALSKH